MTFLNDIPSVASLRHQYPISESLRLLRQTTLQQIEAILQGTDHRLLMIVGPCSADCEASVIEYVSRLARLQEQVKNQLLLIPRVFTAKPRRNGNDYKGLIHQPKIGEGENMAAGLAAARELHIAVARQTGMFAADEMLYPDLVEYFDDVVAYWVVGARSVEDQQHKLVASGVEQAVGMKNPLNGNIDSLLSSVSFASQPHHFILAGKEYTSSGNKLAHCILRGYVDSLNQQHSNYSECVVRQIAEANGTVIIDCNHHNSNKQYLLQPQIAKEVISLYKHDYLLNRTIKGLMIESYLEDAKQSVGGTCFGQSITDACLGWDKTERLINEIAEML